MKYFFLITFLVLFGCTNTNIGRFKPYKLAIINSKGLPYAKGDGTDTEYNYGFEDGCQTMVSLGSIGWNRGIASRVDGWKLTGKHPSLKMGSLYYKGFVDGREHCFYAIEWWSN